MNVCNQGKALCSRCVLVTSVKKATLITLRALVTKVKVTILTKFTMIFTIRIFVNIITIVTSR